MDQEVVTKTLVVKESLTSVRNLVLWAHSVLVWKEKYYPLLLGSTVTLSFLLLWLIDQNVLPKLCLIGIFFTVLDYTLPKIDKYLNKGEWSDKKEAVFHGSCEAVARVWVSLSSNLTSFQRLKRANTKLYYATLLGFLVMLVWIGNVINNLFLAYLLVMFIAFYPGLSHHNMLDKVLPFIYNLAKSVLSMVYTSKPEATNASKKKN